MDKESLYSDDDTLAPMSGPATGNRRQTGGRRNTMMNSGNQGQPRKSIATGLLGRQTLFALNAMSAQRKSKAQEVKLENTYRMEPKPEEKLVLAKLRPLISEAMEESLNFYNYEAATAGKKAQDTAQSVRDRVKDAGFDRYKFAVSVAVLKRRGGDTAVSIGSRCVWSVECGDTYAEEKYKSDSVLAIATVYCCYYE